jgi:hypothetical protein
MTSALTLPTFAAESGLIAPGAEVIEFQGGFGFL